MRIQRGGGGEQDVPIPPEKSQKYRVFYQYMSRSHEKSQSYEASIQCWAIIGTPAKHYLKAFCWRTDDSPAYPFINLKKVFKVGPPLTIFSGSPHKVLWLSVKTQMDCCRMWHYIRVYTVYKDKNSKIVSKQH